METTERFTVSVGYQGEFMAATTKILIVEDEPNMVAGLRDNFEYEGFQVITALDGVEGLERALKDSPDLVVLDVMMPKMSGLDV
jgi:DNA-binding response OmpR family regulator